jgi:tRNA1Val (adenine37-N6)-methyltransferase
MARLRNGGRTLARPSYNRPMQGIVRPARRPPGWVAPGPPPAPPADHLALGPHAGEDLCYLSGDWRILQRLDGHRWSLDDLMTAWVAADECAADPPPSIVDVGCGIGAVLLMMAWRFPEARLVGVEAQPLSVDLARRSVAWNGIEQRCDVRLGDLRDPTTVPEAGCFALVTGTPPYLALGTATESQRPQWGPCHFEHRGGLEAYCTAAGRVMAPDGRFVLCAAVRDDARMRAGAAAADLRVVRRLEVVPRAGKAALFAVYALRRLDRSEAVRVDPPVVVRDVLGHRTESYQRVRRDMGLPP